MQVENLGGGSLRFLLIFLVGVGGFIGIFFRYFLIPIIYAYKKRPGLDTTGIPRTYF
jgi:hypothetical protein